MAEQQAFSK